MTINIPCLEEKLQQVKGEAAQTGLRNRAQRNCAKALEGIPHILKEKVVWTCGDLTATKEGEKTCFSLDLTPRIDPEEITAHVREQLQKLEEQVQVNQQRRIDELLSTEEPTNSEQAEFLALQDIQTLREHSEYKAPENDEDLSAQVIAFREQFRIQYVATMDSEQVSKAAAERGISVPTLPENAITVRHCQKKKEKRDKALSQGDLRKSTAFIKGFPIDSSKPINQKDFDQYRAFLQQEHEGHIHPKTTLVQKKGGWSTLFLITEIRCMRYLLQDGHFSEAFDLMKLAIKRIPKKNQKDCSETLAYLFQEMSREFDRYHGRCEDTVKAYESGCDNRESVERIEREAGDFLDQDTNASSIKKMVKALRKAKAAVLKLEKMIFDY